MFPILATALETLLIVSTISTVIAGVLKATFGISVSVAKFIRASFLVVLAIEAVVFYPIRAFAVLVLFGVDAYIGEYMELPPFLVLLNEVASATYAAGYRQERGGDSSQ